MPVAEEQSTIGFAFLQLSLPKTLMQGNGSVKKIFFLSALLGVISHLRIMTL